MERTDLSKCPGCGSTIGPYLDQNNHRIVEAISQHVSVTNQVPQVICTTCGMRGPFGKDSTDAVQQWNKLPR